MTARIKLVLVVVVLTLTLTLGVVASTGVVPMIDLPPAVEMAGRFTGGGVN
jgi:hypothetical protein